jgi:hypothetical protein
MITARRAGIGVALAFLAVAAVGCGTAGGSTPAGHRAGLAAASATGKAGAGTAASGVRGAALNACPQARSARAAGEPAGSAPAGTTTRQPSAPASINPGGPMQPAPWPSAQPGGATWTATPRVVKGGTVVLPSFGPGPVGGRCGPPCPAWLRSFYSRHGGGGHPPPLAPIPATCALAAPGQAAR